MAKKTYFTPVFLVTSGGINIPGSGGGAYTDTSVDIWSNVTGALGTDTAVWEWFTSKCGSSVDDWQDYFGETITADEIIMWVLENYNGEW